MPCNNRLGQVKSLTIPVWMHRLGLTHEDAISTILSRAYWRQDKGPLEMRYESIWKSISYDDFCAASLSYIDDAIEEGISTKILVRHEGKIYPGPLTLGLEIDAWLPEHRKASRDAYELQEAMKELTHG